MRNSGALGRRGSERFPDVAGRFWKAEQVNRGAHRGKKAR